MPLASPCVLGAPPLTFGGPQRWGSPFAFETMPATTAPAGPAAYLQAVAAKATKAQGLKRPTLAALQQAAKALALAVRIDQAPKGYYVTGQGCHNAPWPCDNLARVAAVLLQIHEKAWAVKPAAPARSLAPYAADLGRALGLGRGPVLPGEAPRPFAARVADDALQALAELSARPEPQGSPERMGFATLNPDTECWAEPLPADCYPPAPAGPQLPAFVTYSQQQQQPQQSPAAPVVAPGPQARKTAPARLPQDVQSLLARFGLSLDGLLTEGLSNAKLAKGAALAWPVILHHLPAKALAQAVAGAKPGPTAPRSRIDGLQALAEREGILSLALAHNGCPWASAGCAAGCLAWAGHGGMSATVAAARARRTLAYLANPAAYGRAVLWAIARAWGRAQAKGLPLAVRLRGTDDLAWHLQRVTISPAEAQALARRYGLPVAPGRGQTLAEALSLAPAGSIRLYEYSKAPLHGPQGLQAQRSAGWDVTASLAADRPDGLSHALAAVGAGFRLAVPVALPKGSALPEALLLRVHPEAGIWRLKCIDGDSTDHRWSDPAGPQPGGFDGVAVILRTKTSRGRGPEAAAFSLAPTFGTWQPLSGGGQAALSTTTWEG